MNDLGALLYKFSIRISATGDVATVKFTAKEHFTNRMMIDALRRLAKAIKKDCEEGKLDEQFH